MHEQATITTLDLPVETREWSEPGDREIHTILYDGMLPPPDGTLHVPWCTGCKLDKLREALVYASPYVNGVPPPSLTAQLYHQRIVAEALGD